MKIYISVGLTHLPRESFEAHTRFIHELAEALSSLHEVKYALVNSDPQLAERPFGERAKLCYQWDKALVEQAELIVADVTFPALGVGIELQIAAERQIPAILCFSSDPSIRALPVVYKNPDESTHELQIGEGFVSLMALGMPNVSAVIPYDHYSEAITAINAQIAQLPNFGG